MVSAGRVLSNSHSVYHTHAYRRPNKPKTIVRVAVAVLVIRCLVIKA